MYSVVWRKRYSFLPGLPEKTLPVPASEITRELTDKILHQNQGEIGDLVGQGLVTIRLNENSENLIVCGEQVYTRNAGSGTVAIKVLGKNKSMGGGYGQFVAGDPSRVCSGDVVYFVRP